MIHTALSCTKSFLTHLQLPVRTGVVLAVSLGIVISGPISPTDAQISPTATPAQPTVEATPAPTASPTPKPKTQRRPPTGIVKDSRRRGSGRLTLVNQYDLDAAVVLTGSTSLPNGVMVYLRAGGKFTLAGIPDGTYDLIVNTGHAWDTGLVAFTEDQNTLERQPGLVIGSADSTAGKRYTAWQISLTPRQIRIEPEQNVPKRPATGVLMDNRDGSWQDGKGEWVIENLPKGDLVAVIAAPTDSPNRRIGVAIYIRGGESFTLTGIPDGVYRTAMYRSVGDPLTERVWHDIFPVVDWIALTKTDEVADAERISLEEKVVFKASKPTNRRLETRLFITRLEDFGNLILSPQFFVTATEQSPSVDFTPVIEYAPPPIPRSIPQVERQPANGTFIVNQKRRDLGQWTIENGNNLDAMAVITSPTQTDIAVAVYIRAGEKVRVTGLEDGEYSLYFQLGKDWDSATSRFTRDKAFYAADQTFAFATKPISGGQQYTTWRVTLHLVDDTNPDNIIRRVEMEEGDFIEVP